MTQSAEIRVMASPAIKEAYLELVPGFERTSGHTVATMWVPTEEMMIRLKGGEIVDLVIISGGRLDELVALGKIAPGSRVDLAKSGVGVAVRAGAPRPDISSPESLKHALLAARSIACSTGPSGVYLLDLFHRMGIADLIKPRLKQVQGVPIGELIARGEAEIGFQQVSELLPVAGIQILGPLPASIQQTTVFSAGLPAGAMNTAPAGALVQFLVTPAAGSVIRKKGMEPG